MLKIDFVPGTYILNKFPAAIYGTGSGKSDEDGLSESGYGVRSKLSPMYVTGPPRDPGER